MNCSCLDFAGMCKHIAAVLYGVGALLDVNPEQLFELRHVDHVDLITTASKGNALFQDQGGDNLVKDDDLSALFDIEMDANTPSLATTLTPGKKNKTKANPRKAKLNDQSKSIAEPIKKISRAKPIFKEP